MELFHAHRQWATRPSDERFSSLVEMRDACRAYADVAVEARAPYSSLRVEAQGEDLRLIGKAGVPALLTHHAFGQLAGRAGAPAGYLRDLSPTLAAQNLNYGLANRSEGDAVLLFHRNGDLVLRAATSEVYERVWNWEVIDRLMDLADRTRLVPARPTFRKTGDDAPALYASDHDMFAFMMSPERAVEDPTRNALYRGLIVANSEVGDKALWLLGFYFREICGNHIIWGAEEIAEIKLVHRSGIRRGMMNAEVGVRRFLDGAASLDEAKFNGTTIPIAGTKDEVLDAVFGKLKTSISRRALSAGYDAVVESIDGDARTPWGLAQGITRHSQTVPYADERTSLDRAAGKLLRIAF